MILLPLTWTKILTDSTHFSITNKGVSFCCGVFSESSNTCGLTNANLLLAKEINCSLAKTTFRFEDNREYQIRTLARAEMFFNVLSWAQGFLNFLSSIGVAAVMLSIKTTFSPKHLMFHPFQVVVVLLAFKVLEKSLRNYEKALGKNCWGGLEASGQHSHKKPGRIRPEAPNYSDVTGWCFSCLQPSQHRVGRLLTVCNCSQFYHRVLSSQMENQRGKFCFSEETSCQEKLEPTRAF